MIIPKSKVSWRRAVPYVTILGAIGVLVVVISSAAGPLAAFEAESGTLSAGAVIASVTGASGPGVVKFGAVVTPTPTSSPTSTPGTLTKLNINTAWQWQLTGTVNETVLDGVSNANKMYDIDMFNATAALISRLKAKGIYVVCYVEAGDWANSRPDAGDFATSLLGKTLSGFPDEKFIDVRALDGATGPTGKTLRQIMTARIDLAKSKGCMGIEPDLDDLHTYNTGFAITQANQVAYNKFLIDAGHARGMTVGLKNGPDGGGAGSFTKAMYDAGADWVVNEECNQYDECGGYSVFIAGGRPVFQVEYLDNQSKPYSGTNGTCAKDNAANFDGIVKDSSSTLAALPRIPCRAGN
jgi:hypothetical protein